MPCPKMVASLIPVSETLNSPNFSCKPSRPWLTSPICPASSPKTRASGYLLKTASKLSLKITRPSTSVASLLYVGRISD